MSYQVLPTQSWADCYYCRGRGIRKLRRRARGRGYGGRYGTCPNCAGAGGKWHRDINITIVIVIDELQDREILRTFFFGNDA
mgnify:CR=1 FL=1